MKYKKVYLTIDDSPSSEMKEKVDFLYRKKIPAIFSCIGILIEENPEPVKNAIKKDFLIGNHSYSHAHFSDIDLKEAFKEIKMCDALIDDMYLQAGKKRLFKAFRFPYGEKGGKNKRELQKYLKKLGYKQPLFKDIKYPYYKKLGLQKDIDMFWTFDTEEYMHKLPEVFEHLVEKKPKQGGSLLNMNSADIVIIHDHEETGEQFFQIIEKMLEMGIQFEKPGLK